MQCVGIIGGIAPESPVDYYRQIVARHRELTGGAYPAIVINSIDLMRMLGFVGARQFDALIAYLNAEIAKLARAGADLALLGSNTPHVVFDELQRLSPIPMISIVEATAAAAVRRQFKRLGLFAT
jgi:aspartate racemase